jgi:plastocyanin
VLYLAAPDPDGITLRRARQVALAPISFVTAEPPEIAVQMTQAKSFEPKTITVKTGDTVVWKNVSDMPHTVTDGTQFGRHSAGRRAASECEGIRFRPDITGQGLFPHIHCSRDL